MSFLLLHKQSCRGCPHYSRGFLSEPDDCGYFKEYGWLVNWDHGKRIDSFIQSPSWCPILPDNKNKSKEELVQIRDTEL